MNDDFEIINTYGTLLNIIYNIHLECYQLIKETFNRYFDNAGNIGVFCHSEEEYLNYTNLSKVITEPSNDLNRKYFRLKTPIQIDSLTDIPSVKYNYLYIRKPDPTDYGKFNGDIDYVLEEKEYQNLLNEVANNVSVRNSTIYQYNDKKLIQLSSPKSKALSYVSTLEIAEYMRIRH